MVGRGITAAWNLGKLRGSMASAGLAARMSQYPSWEQSKASLALVPNSYGTVTLTRW